MEDVLYIYISRENATELTGAHEVGHSLGLQHSDKGIMYATGNSTKRAKTISESEIKMMIKNAVTGEVAKDKNGGEMGKGYLDNEQEIRQIEWIYEVKKAH